MKKFNKELIKNTKNVGKITEADLTGQLRDLSVHLVQRMCEEQVKQGNPWDVTVFQQSRGRAKSGGGFNWDESTEGQDFWDSKIGL